MDYKCSNCGEKDYKVVENQGGIFLICQKCGFVDELKSRDIDLKCSNSNESAIPKCPTCNSTDIQKITGTERAVSVLGLGILSKKINKTYKCKHCGYTW